MKVRFLVVRFSSIGDIVLTTPVVRGLKTQVEGAEVHFVTKARYAPLLESNPYIDKIHQLHDKITPLLDELQAEGFDFVIDLHRNIRSGQIKRRLNVPDFTFDKLNIRKWVLVNFKLNYLPKTHIVERYLQTLSVFDVKNDGQGLDFFVPENQVFPTEELPAAFKNGYVVFVIGGTYFTKRLPAGKVVSICNQIPFPVILLGGKNEAETADEIMAMAKGNVTNLCGRLSVLQSASLISQARLVLTNDTGMMHIAAAYRKKILSFWGNTVPAFGMWPYMPDPASMMLQVESLSCRPCSKLGYNKCPRKHFRCMNDIDIDQAVKWIKDNF